MSASPAAIAVQHVILDAVHDTVAKASVPANPAAAAPIATAVINDVVPMVLNATNNEPWYQSRVTWGAIISAGIPILGALGVATDWIKPDEAASIAVAIISTVGGIVTLYGRWKARKPIGSA